MMTPEAEVVFENAVDEAQRRRNAYLCVEHVLYALTRKCPERKLSTHVAAY